MYFAAKTNTEHPPGDRSGAQGRRRLPVVARAALGHEKAQRYGRRAEGARVTRGGTSRQPGECVNWGLVLCIYFFWGSLVPPIDARNGVLLACENGSATFEVGIDGFFFFMVFGLPTLRSSAY